MTRPTNRGPAAAASNRAALIKAARTLLAEHGFRVPMNAIAKQAGVGQGVLYRHFPRRLDLAIAVFSENFEELDALAAEDRPDAFERFFRKLTGLVLESIGFIEMVVASRGLLPDYDGGDRLLEALGPLMERAKAAGLLGAQVQPADVELGLRMIYGAAVTAVDAERRADAVGGAVAILENHWQLVRSPGQ